MISERARIATRALFDLAFHGAGRQVQAREIADRQHCPIRYLEEILQDLRRAGLVRAQRGPRGGYALARSPEAITLADAVSAVEGDLPTLFAGKPAAPRALREAEPTPFAPLTASANPSSEVGVRAPMAASTRRRAVARPRSGHAGASAGAGPARPVADKRRAVPASPPAGFASGGADPSALIWSEVGARVAAVLAGVTLADVVARAQREGIPRATVAPPQMYFI